MMSFIQEIFIQPLYVSCTVLGAWDTSELKRQRSCAGESCTGGGEARRGIDE